MRSEIRGSQLDDCSPYLGSNSRIRCDIVPRGPARATRALEGKVLSEVDLPHAGRVLVWLSDALESRRMAESIRASGLDSMPCENLAQLEEEFVHGAGVLLVSDQIVAD